MLVATHLTFTSGGQKRLNDVSIAFSKGVHAIVGINGAGKSTLLKTLSGVWVLDSGSVAVDGDNLACWDRRRISRTLSLVPQAPQVYFNYSVEDIVAMGGYPLGRTVDRKTLVDALKVVDVLHLQHRPVMEISAGERQRVYIARALVTGSPVLLLDEPTANLDIRHQLEMWQLMHQLGEAGKVVVVATHDLAATRRYCTTATLLHEGHVIATGAPEMTLCRDNLHDIFGVESAAIASF